MLKIRAGGGRLPPLPAPPPEKTPMYLDPVRGSLRLLLFHLDGAFLLHADRVEAAHMFLQLLELGGESADGGGVVVALTGHQFLHVLGVRKSERV